MVPRLEIYAADTTNADKKKKSSINNRPPQKLFDPKEVQQLSKGSGEGVIPRARGYYQYKNETFKNGFLEKEVKIAGLIVSGVKPSLEEVSKFTSGDSDGNVASKTAEINALIGNVAVDDYEFEAGDSVIVTKGELENLTGIVQSVLHDDVKVEADVKELKVNPMMMMTMIIIIMMIIIP